MLALAERNGRMVGKARPSKPVSEKALRRSSVVRRLALGVGAVGVGVLGLSVTHCTESISLLTGSHVVLSGLLAVGIDAGMVACELAELVSHGTRAARQVRPWARGYVYCAILLSMMLNGYAFGLHAADGMQWAAWVLGGCIPCLVYALGRVAGHLWIGE